MSGISRNTAAGFSLIEVICAVALLGGVLISIAGLMVFGDRLVRSGRHSSEALAVAQGIMEEINGWSFEQTYTLFAGCTADQERCELDSRTESVASGWQEQLDRTLNPAADDDGHAEIVIESLDGLALEESEAIRIGVTVSWTEGIRSREISLATVRM
jgi:prepilin-type N-terminal cleavage/methylation domain-containing protein